MGVAGFISLAVLLTASSVLLLGWGAWQLLSSLIAGNGQWLPGLLLSLLSMGLVFDRRKAGWALEVARWGTILGVGVAMLATGANPAIAGVLVGVAVLSWGWAWRAHTNPR